MARTKKTATKSATPVIVRSLDMPSLEKRVYNMDGAKVRNYDLYSLEKRIYDLEMGGTPEPSGDYVKFYDINRFWDSGSVSPAILNITDIECKVNDTASSWTSSCGFNIKIDGMDYTKVDFDVSGTLKNYGALQMCTRDDAISGSIGSLVSQNQTKLLNVNPNGGVDITLDNEHYSIEIPTDHKKYLYILAATGNNAAGEFSDSYNGSANIIIKNVRFS